MNPRTPANQPYYGPIYGDGMAQSVPFITDSNPETVQSMRRNYGRYLAGFGGESMSGQVGYDPRYQGREVYDLESEDDVFGSGIFDPKGRGGTSNADMGVFASHDSLPGYIARGKPFTVSNDVTDITDNAEVVSIPAGGLLFVQGSRTVLPGGRPRLPQAAPVPAVPPRLRAPVLDVPKTPYERLVATTPAYRRVPTRSIVAGHLARAPIAPARNPVAHAAPDLPMGIQVPFRQTVNVAPAGPPLPISGYGAYGSYGSYGCGCNGYGNDPSMTCPEGQVFDIDTETCVEDTTIPPTKKEPASAAQLAVAGLAIGAVAGLLVGVLRKGGARR